MCSMLALHVQSPLWSVIGNGCRGPCPWASVPWSFTALELVWWLLKGWLQQVLHMAAVLMQAICVLCPPLYHILHATAWEWWYTI
jgi:hypothetical protein